jgi:hypothetical protein
MALKRYPIVWAGHAIIDKNNIVQYLEENWSATEIQSFLKKIISKD